MFFQNMLLPCQHASGASFVQTVVDGLMPSGKVAPVILDLMGYDASPALYTLSRVAAGIIGVSILCGIFSKKTNVNSQMNHVRIDVE
jgi:hypothetical protein